MLIVIFEFRVGVLIFADKVHKVRNVHKVLSAIFYTFPLVLNCILGRGTKSTGNYKQDECSREV